MFDIRCNRLNGSGDRLFEIELTAVRTHLGEVKKLLKTKDDFQLEYVACHGEKTKKGSIAVEDPVMFLRFEKNHDPDGVWQVEVWAVSKQGQWRRALWRQNIFVQKELSLSSSAMADLAQRYAPIFLFSQEERYFPVSLRKLLCDPMLREGDEVMKLRTIFGRERVPLSELGEFMRFNGHSDYLLDFNFLSMRRSVFAKLGGSIHDATVYYSHLEDEHRIFLTYHLLYAFDTKAGLSRLSGIGPHVFDRESMILVFEKSAAARGDLQPSAMVISGHLENQTISLLGRSKLWKQGRISVPYEEARTLKLAQHPVIAVAEGSHALYPTSGVYQLSLLRELAGYIDPALHDSLLVGALRRAGKRSARKMCSEQVLLPPACPSSRSPHYRLVALGLDRMTSHIADDPSYDGHNAFLCFSGFWVDVPGTQNARFPPFTRKMTAIDSWVDGAYPWDWDAVPERYHDNNRLILQYLRENQEDF